MVVFIKDFTKVTDTKYRIGFIHYRPFDKEYGMSKTKEELEEEGKLVELPNDSDMPVEVDGKSISLFYNPIKGELFYDYDEPAPEPTPEPEPEKTQLEKEIESLKQQVLDTQATLLELQYNKFV